MTPTISTEHHCDQRAKVAAEVIKKKHVHSIGLKPTEHTSIVTSVQKLLLKPIGLKPTEHTSIVSNMWED